MDIGKRLTVVGAITVTMGLAGVVGVTAASGRPLPPGDPEVASAEAVAIAAPAPGPAVPTFVKRPVAERVLGQFG